MPLIITDPAASARLTTLDAVKAELGLAGSDQDAYAAGLIDQASAAIAAWCGRSFAVEGIRETFHLDASDTLLLLSRWPVVEVTSVTVNGLEDSPGRAEVEAGLLYRLDANGCRMSWPPGRIRVEYHAGYILPDDEKRTLPADVERAALSMVKSWFFARGSNPMVRSESVEGISSVSYFDPARAGLTVEAEALLSAYRSRVFA